MPGLFDMASPSAASSGGLLAQPGGGGGFLPGLLADPWFRIGMALLARGGPQGKAHSVGQDIAGAVSDVQAGADQDVERQLQQMQLEQARRTAEITQRAYANAQEWMKSMMGGDATASPATAQAPSATDLMPTPQQAPVAADGALAIPDQYKPIINRASFNTGVPANILAAQIQHESSWNPGAKGDAGEVGLSQFMPDTGKQYGLMSEADRADPEKSITAQARYMADLFRKTGSWDQALWQYNASPNNPKGAKYAATVLKLAGENVPDALNVAPGGAPTAAPQPASTAAGASTLPASQAGAPAAPIAQMPDEVRKQLLVTAYQQSGGDPLKMMGAFAKAQQDWILNQAKASSDAAAQIPVKQVESDLAGQRAAASDARSAAVAYDKKTGEDSAAQFDEMMKSLPQRQADIGNIDDMIGALKSGVRTGYGSETLLGFKQAMQQAGINIDTPESVGQAEFFRSSSNRLLFALRQQQAQNGTKDPNPSNADLKFQEKIIPSMENTPTGNALLLLQLKRNGEMGLEMTQAAQAFKQRTGRFSSQDFPGSPEAQAVFKKYKLTEGQLDSMVAQAKQITGAAPQPMPPSPKTPAERDALAPGTVYIAPDGSRRVR